MISNKVQNVIITICQTIVRQILFKDILETIHFLTFLVFITVFPTIVCNFAREIHLLRRDTPICRTNQLYFHQAFTLRFSCRFAFHFPLIRLYTKDSSASNEAVAIIYTSRSWGLNGTSLFKRCIQLSIYLVISYLLIYVLRFVKQFRLFCRTIPVESSSKT